MYFVRSESKDVSVDSAVEYFANEYIIGLNINGRIYKLTKVKRSPNSYVFVSPNGRHWLGHPRPAMNIIYEFEDTEGAELVVCEDFEEFYTWYRRNKNTELFND